MIEPVGGLQALLAAVLEVLRGIAEIVRLVRALAGV